MKRHTLRISAAQLMLTVEADGGDFRMWQGLGGPSFFYLDRTGHCIAGWEENRYDVGAVCVVYHGCQVGVPKGMMRRSPLKCNCHKPDEVQCDVHGPHE